MGAGAAAFLRKDTDAAVVVDALQRAVGGREPSPAVDSPRTETDRYLQLSKRELEILSRMVAGRRNKEIAFELEISPKTVATHRVRLLRKLDLSDDRELLLYAVRNGLADWA